MPTTACPHCGRVIQIEIHEPGTLIECVQCKGRFAPAVQGTAASDASLQQRAGLDSGTAFKLGASSCAFAFIGGLLGCLLDFGIAYLSSANPPTNSNFPMAQGVATGIDNLFHAVILTGLGGLAGAMAGAYLGASSAARIINRFSAKKPGRGKGE